RLLGWLCPQHFGPSHPSPAPFRLWRPILRGPVDKAFCPWPALCILQPHRAVELGEREVALSAFPVSTPCFQAVPGPRAFCVPRIILTECAPNPPSMPEVRLEETGPRTAPTPRPRTLADSRRGWDGPQALPGAVGETPGPRSGFLPQKEGAVLKTLGRGGRNPEDKGARVPGPQGPAQDGTPGTSTADTYPEETLKDPGHDAQTCSRESQGQAAASSGCTAWGATARRMDSLEETLRELEATLSNMGTGPAVGPPGSPPSLPLGPQVAAPSSSSPAAFLLHFQSRTE
uniref:Uncharacterized protein n=1 Tax=Saimiri boliviensis boliviensis TaxID=39432 RepID=A0A2K6SKK0_SAIBB